MKFWILILAVFGPLLNARAAGYRYEIMARTGEAGLMGLHSQVSINDSNRVAFIGQETTDYTYNTSLWVADGNGAIPYNVTFGAPNVNIEYPQINNNGFVVARMRVSGLPTRYYVRAWDSETGNSAAIDATRCDDIFCTFVNLPSISDDGYTAYLEFDDIATPSMMNLKTSGFTWNAVVASFPQGFTLRPKIANGGIIVARAGDSSTDPITLYNEAGIISTIASSPRFASLGSAPGISDDGRVIAFYGEDSEGPGIFASIQVSTGRVIERVANPDVDQYYSQGFIGVTSPRGNPEAFAVVYIGSSKGNDVIYKSVITSELPPREAFVVDPPSRVVTTGDTIFEDANGDGVFQAGVEKAMGGVVSYLDIYDPVNNQGDIAFWVETTTGDQGIVRASRYILGLDVSRRQGAIDWSQVRGTGRAFAMAKATQSTGFTDPKFTSNMQNGKDAGLFMGCYHFAEPEHNSPEQEAHHFLEIAGPYITFGRMRPALDMEDSPNDNSYPKNLGVSGLAAWIDSWMLNVRSNTGVMPFIYCDQTYAAFLPARIAQNYDLWIADPTDNLGTVPKLGSWSGRLLQQYSFKGSLSGISGDVDLDAFYGTQEEFLAKLVIPVPKFGGVSGSPLQAPQNGRFQFQISCPVNQPVVVQASEDAIHWTDVGSAILDNGIAVFTDSTAAGVAARFYRSRP